MLLTYTVIYFDVWLKIFESQHFAYTINFGDRAFFMYNVQEQQSQNSPLPGFRKCCSLCVETWPVCLFSAHFSGPDLKIFPSRHHPLPRQSRPGAACVPTMPNNFSHDIHHTSLWYWVYCLPFLQTLSSLITWVASVLLITMSLLPRTKQALCWVNKWKSELQGILS